MHELKHVVAEKHEFDIQDESKFVVFWSFRTFSILLESFQKLMLESKTFVRVLKLLIENGMEETMPIKREKDKSEYHVKSIFNVLFGIFIRFIMQAVHTFSTTWFVTS